MNHEIFGVIIMVDHFFSECFGTFKTIPSLFQVHPGRAKPALWKSAATLQNATVHGFSASKSFDLWHLWSHGAIGVSWCIWDVLERSRKKVYPVDWFPDTCDLGSKIYRIPNRHKNVCGSPTDQHFMPVDAIGQCSGCVLIHQASPRHWETHLGHLNHLDHPAEAPAEASQFRSEFCCVGLACQLSSPHPARPSQFKMGTGQPIIELTIGA